MSGLTRMDATDFDGKQLMIPKDDPRLTTQRLLTVPKKKKFSFPKFSFSKKTKKAGKRRRRKNRRKSRKSRRKRRKSRKSKKRRSRKRRR